MGAEHLIFVRESAWGTYLAPTEAFPVGNVTLRGNQAPIENNDTGFGRARRAILRGKIDVGGDVATSLYVKSVGKILRSAYGTRAKTSSVSTTTVAISSSSVANPTLITTGAAHGLKVGDRITIATHTGSTPSLNGEHLVTAVPSSTTFNIAVNVTVGGTGGTLAKTAIRNKLLPQDDTAFDSFSLQKRYATAYAESIRGARLSGWRLEAKAGEIAKLAMMFAAKDFAASGGTWTDGTSAPAVVDPVPYAANVMDPLIFSEGSIRLGGSVALTSGELVVTGGTARASFDNLKLEVMYNPIVDDYQIFVDDRTIGSLDPGKRVIKCSFEPNQAIVNGEFLNLWKNGTDAVIELIFQQAVAYGAAADGKLGYKVTFPLARYSAAPNADLNNEYALKRVPVVAEIAGDPVTGVDHGLVITSIDDLTI